jgi:hypothetical protein
LLPVAFPNYSRQQRRTPLQIKAQQAIQRYNTVQQSVEIITNKEKIMGDLGFLGIIHLALVVYAALQIFNSSADIAKKILWIVIVAVFPLIGLIVWFFIGPGTPKK